MGNLVSRCKLKFVCVLHLCTGCMGKSIPQLTLLPAHKQIHYDRGALQAGWRGWCNAASNTWRDQKEHHTPSQKTQTLFPALILRDRLLKGNGLWERMKGGKKTVQVRRKHTGIQNVSGNKINLCFLCYKLDCGKIKLTATTKEYRNTHRSKIYKKSFFLLELNINYIFKAEVGDVMALTAPSFHGSRQTVLLCQLTLRSQSRLGDKELNITDTEPLHMLVEPPVLLSPIHTSSFQEAADWSWFSSSVFDHLGSLRWVCDPASCSSVATKELSWSN